MSGCVKSELYKLLFHPFMYACIGCVFAVNIGCALFADADSRIFIETEYFSYIYLLICNLAVGSILANEFGSTLKDRVLAVGNRTGIFISKVFACLFSISGIYLLHACMVTYVNGGVNANLFVNQYLAVIEHTFLLIGAAVIVKSFSALSVVSVVMLCVYKELSNVDMPGYAGAILSHTYYNRFTAIDEMLSVNVVIWAVVVFCVIIGYLLFRFEDIR